MKPSMLHALAADAYHQVLDNWVFRILTLLTAVPILLTFTVGLREDEIVLLFGLKSWSYASLFASLEAGLLPRDPQGTVIQFVLQLCFEFLAGSLGMLLCIAATAFFVPRLLEKGAAELYFHKPVSRLALYLSRYVAGLLFIALAAGVLVIGMYLGLLLVSGFNDPGILVAALHLTYVFALIHAFSMLVGVVTRSTVAAILVSALFFLFNGCVHQGWIAFEQDRHGPEIRLDDDEEPAEERGEAAQAPASEEQREGSALRGLRVTLDVLHFVLPKTTDADFFARKLRRAIHLPEFRDEDSLVVIPTLPAGLSRLDEAALTRLAPASLPPESLGEPRFAASSGQPAATLSLWRRATEKSESKLGERVRTRVESTSQAGQALEKRLEAAGASALARDSRDFGAVLGGRELSGSSLRWQLGEAGGARACQALVFKGSSKDWVYTLLVEAQAGVTPEQLAELAQGLEKRMGLDLAASEEWYPRQLAFDAPLRFNIAFSLGSSLLFAALMLFLGAWRLGRIAF